MKELVILSGKGGTGKTSIVGSFAAIAQNKVMADCDVDAADLHLLLNPSVKEEKEFQSGQVAVIDEDKCIQCGLCQDSTLYTIFKLTQFPAKAAASAHISARSRQLP
jgi:MinD superfamily P-loop ATPase